jgi:choline dehydrogenase-like flavoprotein
MFLAKRFIIPEFRRKLSMVEHAAAGELKQDGRFWMRHGANVVAGAPAVAGFLFNWGTQHTLAYRKLPYVALRSRAGVYPLDFNGEQAPNLDSRVSLSDQVDAFGVPRLKIDWRMNDLDARTLAATLRDLRDAFARSGCGVVEFDDAALDEQARSALPVGGHHIGTARMAADPSQGVVDADCKVHHLANLHIGGCATFPTSSHANPTLTIVAMALRLAEHLKGALK